MIRKYATIDKNNIISVIHNYPTSDDFNGTSDSFVDITDLKPLPIIGDVYIDGIFYSAKSTEAVSHLKAKIFDPVRNKAFKETMWARYRHSDRVDLGIDDAENWNEWLHYWQKLRDLPEETDFNPIAEFSERPE